MDHWSMDQSGFLEAALISPRFYIVQNIGIEVEKMGLMLRA